MLSDGFGDHPASETDDQIIEGYHKWLHKVAYAYTDYDDERHDDLVQEGRIAMWRALSTYDPSKGALPSWLTTAAQMRMKDLAFGHGQPTGREATRGKREVQPTSSVEALLDEGLESVLGSSDSLSGVEMSYHQGEIWKALESLSPAQRRYVFLRFWGGIEPSSREPWMLELKKQFPDVAKRALWHGSSKQVGAQERLREALAHLIPA